MKELDLSKFNISKILSARKVFFVGIGGIGISAIARMFLLEGKEVFGSDMSENEVTNELKNLGVNISVGQEIGLIPSDVDLIVYTIAVPKYDKKFFDEIKNNFKIPILSYPEMLGVVTKDKYTIAISGTHGKTTTTAMIGKILMDAGFDPSIIVGSLLKDYKSNFILGKSEFFVVEACEYERSFLNLHPKILVITNVESEHLDYYKDLNDIQSAFDQMKSQSENVIEDYSKYIEKVPRLLVPGMHNRQNAAAALAVADMLGINFDSARKSLQEFTGTWRRLEKRGETEEGTIVYDDYAHHPTEIKASLEGLRELYPKGNLPAGKAGKKITVLFQPHLYSRTRLLFDDFTKSFKDADKVLLLPIYFAREAKDESVSSEKLAEGIVKEGVDALYLEDFEVVKTVVEAMKLGENDVFVAMGAGEAGKAIDQVFKIGH